MAASPGRYAPAPQGSAADGSCSCGVCPIVAPWVFVVMKLATWSRYDIGNSLSWINFVAASYGFCDRL